MNTVAAERILLFYICVYWVFFGVTFLRLLWIVFEVFYRRTTRWTHAKTIHATIVSALLARSIHLTLLHFVDEGRNLFMSAQDEALLFKILGSIPGHILVTIYSLLALLWLSILAKTYDVSPMLIPKRFTLFGRTYDASTTAVLKQHLKVACVAFNIFLYITWFIFSMLLWKFRESDTIYSVESIFTAATGLVLAGLFAVYWKRVRSHYEQQGSILSVEKLHVSKRILLLVVICSIVFIIKFPLVVIVSVSHTPWLTSFTFDLITFTLLEIIPFLIILILIGGKKVDEMRHESANFSFSFRKYNNTRR